MSLNPNRAITVTFELISFFMEWTRLSHQLKIKSYYRCFSSKMPLYNYEIRYAIRQKIPLKHVFMFDSIIFINIWHFRMIYWFNTKNKDINLSNETLVYC